MIEKIAAMPITPAVVLSSSFTICASDLPLRRIEQNRITKSCTAPPSTTPIKIQSALGKYPNWAASTGPTSGPGPSRYAVNHGTALRGTDRHRFAAAAARHRPGCPRSTAMTFWDSALLGVYVGMLAIFELIARPNEFVARGATPAPPQCNGPGRRGIWASAPRLVAQPSPWTNAASEGSRLKLTVVRRIWAG